MTTSEPGPIPVDQLGKSVEALVSMGCDFVVKGDAFNATLALIEKLLTDADVDPNGQAFLLQLRGALISSSVPVRAKIKMGERTGSVEVMDPAEALAATTEGETET